jgi:hypothetical protein
MKLQLALCSQERERERRREREHGPSLGPDEEILFLPG